MSRPLPRFTDQAITTDPLEILLAQREAEQAKAREAINRQAAELRAPLNPRGWPIQTRGVGSTIQGTSPHAEAQNGNMDNHRLRSVRR